MSSAPDKTKTKYCPYLYWKQYAEKINRKSRNYALTSVLACFAVFLLFCTAFSQEKTVTLQAGKPETVLIVRTAQVYSQPPKPEKMKKILTEKSDFKIPAEQIREMPKPEPQKTIPKAEPKKDIPPKKKTEQPKLQKKEQKLPKTAKTEKQKTGIQAARQTEGIQSPAGQNIPQALGNTAPKEAAESKMLAVLMRHIEKNKTYPRQARRSNAEGSCLLKITVSSQGKVTASVLQKKSGKRVLDIACEKLGQKLVGIDVGVKQAATVTVPVHYSLAK